MTTESVKEALSRPEPVAPMSDAPPPRTPRDDQASDGPPRDPIHDAACQPLNDFGNSQRFCIHFGEDVMFVPRVGWFTWEGTHWQKDPDELAVRRRAQQIGPLVEREADVVRALPAEFEALAEIEAIRAQMAEFGETPNADRTPEHKATLRTLGIALSVAEKRAEPFGKRVERRRTWARDLGNSDRMKKMVSESETSLAVTLDALDANPLAVNCLSGLVVARRVLADEGGQDLVPRAEISVSPHAREQRITKIMPVEFSPESVAPRWTSFLARVVPDPHIRAFLQRWFGVSMTAEPLQHMAFLYGMGANGKSVLVDTLARVMGDYAATARIESLTGTNRRGGGDATPDLIPLIGARMVRTSEPDEGAKLQEALIKELTGGEPILVRALHADFVEVKPVFKLTMSGNHKPDIRGTDDGIWRRFLMVPFDVQIPEAERDPHLVEKLWEERDGIFAWLIDGLRAFIEQGLAPPAAVLEATAEFRAEQDPVGDFLASCCWITGEPEQSIPARELAEAFRYWQMMNGSGAWTERTVSLRLGDKAEKWRHPKTGATFSKRKASVMMFSGIDLTGTWRAQYERAERDGRGQIRPPIGTQDDTPHPESGF